jgi:hypothetical protein|tara:strand:- start:6131 stop:6295 length:165 start_codon:yes stop_codon:yes gene_type:complete
MENSKQWQDNSDGWVTAMNASKEMKEKYNIYMKEELKKSEGKIMSYRKWLRENK